VNDDRAKAALDQAFANEGQLLLVYQPIHDARSRQIWAAEALLRQRRENGELREASIITEAAEESSGPELFLLNTMLVQQAYTEGARWQKERGVRLNVNLSPREFQEGDVLKRLCSLMTSCGIDTRKVNLEITETSYIDKPEETMDVLIALRGLGLQLWLDDFGTGHSSLTHLQRFPVDGIKLSGDFVRPLPGDVRSAKVVASLIALAHDLGMKVVAEEVERQEQLDFLLDCGCDYIQGFLFSKPMPGEEFEELLRRRL
jgi:EAL domain-containing protein (putative c-di-GMP-specific phosphodiesterase class I)